MRLVFWGLWACSSPSGRARVDVYEEPLDPSLDADQDGIIDSDERRIDTHPRRADTDGDGLEDGEELILGTDPLLPDTDGDTISDGDELEMELDPNEPDTGMPVAGIFYGGGGCDQGGSRSLWNLTSCAPALIATFTLSRRRRPC